MQILFIFCKLWPLKSISSFKMVVDLKLHLFHILLFIEWIVLKQNKLHAFHFQLFELARISNFPILFVFSRRWEVYSNCIQDVTIPIEPLIKLIEFIKSFGKRNDLGDYEVLLHSFCKIWARFSTLLYNSPTVSHFPQHNNKFPCVHAKWSTFSELEC